MGLRRGVFGGDSWPKRVEVRRDDVTAAMFVPPGGEVFWF